MTEASESGQADSLYHALGVEKGAGKDAIRDAFKKLAKIHHPDMAGGRNETFDRIKAAYDTLMDDRARMLYDEFGLIPGDDASLLRVQAMSRVSQLFAAILVQTNAEALERLDLIGEMKQQVVARIGELETACASLERRRDDFVAARIVLEKRLKRKGRDGPDIFLKVLDDTLNGIPDQIARLRRESDLQRATLDLLDGYQFDFKAKPPETTFVVLNRFTTTTW